MRYDMEKKKTKKAISDWIYEVASSSIKGDWLNRIGACPILQDEKFKVCKARCHRFEGYKGEAHCRKCLYDFILFKTIEEICTWLSRVSLHHICLVWKERGFSTCAYLDEDGHECYRCIKNFLDNEVLENLIEKN